MHNKFNVALVAAALVVATTAHADDTKKVSAKKKTQPTTTQTQPQGQTQTDKKDDGTPAKEQAGKKMDEADQSADQTNRDVVGNGQQNENEREAQDPKLRKQKPEDVQKPAEKIGKTTTNAAEVVGNGVQDATSATDRAGAYRPFEVSWNPLGLIVGGRVSFNGEWAPVTHHAVIVSPHFITTSQDVVSGADQSFTQRYTGVGGEVGYRYYTGHRGPNGVFVGPSLLGGVYNAGLQGKDQAFTNIGVAADVGVQGILWEHFLLGGGVGVEYLHVSHDFGDLPSGPAAIAESGVKPRLLLQGGAAF